jgi:hypothetical protein
MAQQNVFKVEVEALDSGQGYLIRGLLIVDGTRTEINEHHATEALVRTRLGTGFDVWAAQVDAE